MQESFSVLGPLIVVQLLALAVGAVAFVFWLWMLIECLRRKDLSDGEKIAWTVVIVLVSCLGSIIYFFASRRSQRRFT